MALENIVCNFSASVPVVTSAGSTQLNVSQTQEIVGQVQLQPQTLQPSQNFQQQNSPPLRIFVVAHAHLRYTHARRRDRLPNKARELGNEGTIRVERGHAAPMCDAVNGDDIF